MATIKFTVPIEPMPARRPRFAGGVVYNDPKYTAFKAAVAHYARRAMQGREPLTGAVKLTADFYRRRKPTSRTYGDADNHLKSICDAMNGICYLDDAQVTIGTFTKNRGEGHIDIQLEEL